MESIDRSLARRRANKAILLILGGFVSLLLIAFVVFLNVAFKEPLGDRHCDCELIVGWLSGLPILDQAELTGESVGGSNHVGIGASVHYEGEHLTEEQRADLVFAMKEQGLNLDVVGLSSEDRWYLRVFPGELVNGGFVPNEPWVFHVVDHDDGGVTLRVTSHVPAERWGIDTLDELWDIHQDDPVEAARIETERQQELIAMLEPVTAGASAMDGS